MPDDFFEDIPDATTPRPVKVGRRPRIKSPNVRLDGVDPELVSFAADEDAVVTSGMDSPGVHKPHSQHGSGRALDLRTRDRTPAQIQQMQERAQARGLHAAFERGGVGGATGDHLHVSRGGQRPPVRPQAAPAENFFDDVPDAQAEDFFADIPDVPRDVSRATPQVTSQPQVPSQVPAPVAPPSVATGRPELPQIQFPPPAARESVPETATPPAVIPQPSTTPQPATPVGTEPAGAGQTPAVNFPALDRPGYADALNELIQQRGAITHPRQLADYLQWIDQASEHGDLADPAFRAQVVAGKVQSKVQRPGATSQSHGRPSAALRAAIPAAPPVPAQMSGPDALPPAQSGEPETRPVIENGAIRVATPPDATAESLLYRGFYDLAKSRKLPDALADQYASRIASESQGFKQGDAFMERARTRGSASINVRPEHLDLLRQYEEEFGRKANIEAQMTAETGVMQSSTDEERRHEQELRHQAEAEVAREMPPAPQMTPEGVPSPDPSRELAERETRTREVETRVNQRLAMERIHGALSQLVIDRPKLKEEMRAAVNQEFREAETSPAASRSRQEYAGMTGMLPGMRMRETDRLAEERTQSLIDDIQYAKESTDPNAAVGVVQSIFQRFRRNPLVLAPVVSTLADLDDTLKARDASERIQTATAQGRAPEQRDTLILQAHQALEHTNKTFWASVGDILVEQPAFWGEFYLTGPAAGAVEGAVGRGLARVGIRGLEEGAEIGAGALRSRLGARVLGDAALEGTTKSLAERSAYKVGEIVSKMVQTTASGGMRTATVGLPRVAEGYAERRMKGEDGPTAFLHSVLDQAGEYISESQGDVLEILPGMKRLDDALRPVMKKMESAGYHGVVGEIYEERWKDLYDVATGLKTWAEVKEKWEDPNTWGIEAVGFALPGVGRAAAHHAGAALGQMRQEFAGKLEDLNAHIAELQAQPATEETAEAVAQAQEEQQHYTGLVEQIDTHEEEVTKQEAEVAAAEQQQPAATTVESSSEAGAPGKGEEVPTAQGGQVAAEVQPAGTPVVAESHERDKVTGVTQAEEGATPAPARSEAEDFADEIMREMGGGSEAEAATGQVDGHGFREFPAERQSLGVPRAQMPQVKGEHRGALVNYLEARGVEHEEMMVRPAALKPTQAEYSPEKVEKAREYEGGNRATLVSGDGYVLDGQHQLEQAREDAPEEPYRVIVLHGDARDLLPLIHDFPSSTVNKESEGGPKAAPTDAESFADGITGELSGAEQGQTQPDVTPASPEDESLYRRAVEVTRDTGRLSTSHLQRTLKIGYGPASRLVQRMRDDGTAARYGIVDAHIAPAAQTEAAPSNGEEERGPGRADLTEGMVAHPPVAGEPPNMSTPVTQTTGVADSITQSDVDAARVRIRQHREDVKTKLEAAHRRRLAKHGAVEPGSELRHGGPAIPSREEVVLTAELLLTYAQEGTLLFKDAARRFVEDVGSAEYARELSKAFEAGWRLLKKKGHEVDEAGTLAEHLAGTALDSEPAAINDEVGRSTFKAEDRQGMRADEAESGVTPLAEGESRPAARLQHTVVVDAEGRPLKVLHGTPYEFTQFDPSKYGSESGDPNATLGPFFTTDLSEARLYTKDRGRVLEVYLDIRHPYEISDTALAGKEPEDVEDLRVELEEGGYDGLQVIVEDIDTEEPTGVTWWVPLSVKQVVYPAAPALPAAPLTVAPDDFALPGLAMTAAEVKEAVQNHLEEIYSKDELEVIDLAVIGSRAAGTSRERRDLEEGSDLDVVVEFSSREDLREDDVFNYVNDDEFGRPLYLKEIKVDINPITADNSGTLDEYLARLAALKPKRERDERDDDADGGTGHQGDTGKKPEAATGEGRKEEAGQKGRAARQVASGNAAVWMDSFRVGQQITAPPLEGELRVVALEREQGFVLVIDATGIKHRLFEHSAAGRGVEFSDARGDKQPTPAEAKASVKKEKIDPRTGLNDTQEGWLGGQLEDYAERHYIGTESYPRGDADNSPVKLLEHFGRINSKTAYAEAGEPETFDVPGDGSFTVNNVEAANRLHQKITGAPIAGLPKEQNATVRVGTPKPRASKKGASFKAYVAAMGGDVPTLKALKKLHRQLTSDPEAAEQLGVNAFEVRSQIEALRSELDKKRDDSPVRGAHLAEVNKKIAGAESFPGLKTKVDAWVRKRAGRGKDRQAEADADIAKLTPEDYLVYNSGSPYGDRATQQAQRDIRSAQRQVADETGVPVGYGDDTDIRWFDYERQRIGDDAADALYEPKTVPPSATKTLTQPKREEVKKTSGVPSEPLKTATEESPAPANLGNPTAPSAVGSEMTPSPEERVPEEEAENVQVSQAGSDVTSTTKTSRAPSDTPETLRNASLYAGQELFHEVVTDRAAQEAGRAFVRDKGVEAAIESYKATESPDATDQAKAFAAIAELQRQEREVRTSDPAEADRLLDQVNDLVAVMSAKETVQARGLRAVRFAEVFGEASAVRAAQKVKAEVRPGATLTADEARRITDLARDLKETQEKLSEAEARAAEAEKELAAERVVKEIGEREQRKPRQGVRAKTKEVLDTEFAALKAQFVKARAEIKNSSSTFGANLAKIDPEGKVLGIVAQMAKNRVRAGVNTAAELVDEIFNVLKEHVEDLTKRDVRDWISGYGKTVEMSKERTAAELRELKRQLRLVSALEDVEGGELPKRTGLQREPESQRVRELRRQVGDVMRQQNLRPADARPPEERWKSALNSVKTRLAHESEDLNRRLETGAPANAKTKLAYDAEATRLQAERNRLKRQLAEIEGPKARTLEQRVAAARRGVERGIQDLERRLAAQDYSKGASAASVMTPELEILRAHRDALREQYEDLRPAPTEADLLAAAKKRLKKSITEAEERLREVDFSPQPKRQIIRDREVAELQQRRQALRRQLAAEYDKLRPHAGLRKAGRGVLSAANLARAMKASSDFFGAVFRQGRLLAADNLRDAGRIAFAEQFKALSKIGFAEAYEAMAGHEDMPLAHHFNVNFTGEPLRGSGHLSAKEEGFQTDLSEYIPIVSHSERSFTASLDWLRLLAWSSGVEELRGHQVTPENNPEAYYALARWINYGSGRGSFGKIGNQFASALNPIFFAPRYRASRVQALWMVVAPNTPAPVRKIVARAMFKYYGTVGIVLLLGAMFDVWRLSLDPDDADFLKPRIGDKHYDLTGGERSDLRLLFRLSGAFYNKARGVENTPSQTPTAILKQYLRSALSPAAGVVASAAGGTNFRGERFSGAEEAPSAFVPMSLDALYEGWRTAGGPGIEEVWTEGLSGKFTLQRILSGLGGAASSFPEVASVSTSSYKTAPQDLQATRARATRYKQENHIPLGDAPDEPSPYTPLKRALEANDPHAARLALKALRKEFAGGARDASDAEGSADDKIYEAMRKWAARPFTGAHKTEDGFIKSLQLKELGEYAAAKRQMAEAFERFVVLWAEVEGANVRRREAARSREKDKAKTATERGQAQGRQENLERRAGELREIELSPPSEPQANRLMGLEGVRESRNVEDMRDNDIGREVTRSGRTPLPEEEKQEIAETLQRLDARQFESFTRALDESRQIGRLGEGTAYVAERAAGFLGDTLGMENASESAELLRMARRLAVERRLRPLQFKYDTAGGDYGAKLMGWIIQRGEFVPGPEPKTPPIHLRREIKIPPPGSK